MSGVMQQWSFRDVLGRGLTRIHCPARITYYSGIPWGQRRGLCYVDSPSAQRRTTTRHSTASTTQALTPINIRGAQAHSNGAEPSQDGGESTEGGEDGGGGDDDPSNGPLVFAPSIPPISLDSL